jgi:hypothetical protein
MLLEPPHPMRLLARLAWPVTFVGLLVILGAGLLYMAKDQQLETQYRIAADQWRPGPADAISHRRAQLTMWPGMLVGAVVTALGIVLLDLRRRRRIEWEMEGRLDDGRPVAFRAPGREEE